MKTRYGLEIRAATPADAPGLSEFLKAAGQEIASHALGARLDAMRAESGAVLIAAEWGPPSGLVILHWYRTLHAAHPTAQITTLLVATDARRRGIGRLLVKAAAQAARIAGCDSLQFLAAVEARTSRQFCLATGFAEDGAIFERALRKKG